MTFIFDEAGMSEFEHGPIVRQKLVQAAAHMAAIAKQHAAVDTGFMRDHVRVEDEYSDAVSVVSEADYSAPQEFGTYKMAGHPFMRPALTETQGKVG